MVTVQFKKRSFFQDKMREVGDIMQVSKTTYHELKQYNIVDNLNDPSTIQTKSKAPKKRSRKK